MPRNKKGQSDVALATRSNHDVTSLDSMQQALLQCFSTQAFTDNVSRAVKPLIDNLQHEIMANRNVIKLQQKQIQQHEEKIALLEKYIKVQENKMNACEKKINTDEKVKRLDKLRVFGLPEDILEAEKKFIDVIKEKMDVELKGTDDHNPDISIFEVTTGTNNLKKSQENRPNANTETNKKSVKIIKFHNIWKRRQVYNARSQLRNTDLYLNEDLNAEERQIFYKCRMMRKEGKITATWTKDLKIICRTLNNEIHQIENMQQLHNLQKNIETPVIPIETTMNREDYENFFKEEPKLQQPI